MNDTPTPRFDERAVDTSGMTTSSVTTPQTTRCRVRINVTGQGQHQCEEPAVEGGYCAKHQSAFSCHLIPPVPAPSAPARAGNDDGTMCEDCEVRPPTEFFENAVGLCGLCAIQREVNMLSPEGKAHVLALARALAPATAEPTAWACVANDGEVYYFSRRAERHQADEMCARYNAYDDETWTRLQPFTVVALSRGSGPVGQAKPAQWQFRFLVTSTKEWLPWVNCNREFAEEALADSVREGAAEIRALYAAPVAASAEAKRVETSDDTKRLDFLEKTRDEWVQADSRGEPELIAHTWMIERDRTRIAAQTMTLREAIDAEMAAHASPNTTEKSS